MRVISTKVHGAVDYILGIVLIAAPNILGFDDVGGAAEMVPRIIGVMLLLSGLMTKHELGVVKVISMVNHLRLDYLAALFLAASPFLFSFSDEETNAWLPHVVLGLGYFVFSMMSKGTSIDEKPAAEK